MLVGLVKFVTILLRLLMAAPVYLLLKCFISASLADFYFLAAAAMIWMMSSEPASATLLDDGSLMALLR